ncbi:hypothetical protein SUGI_0401350 [Cryptomeria japonica]|nr:hypothetical protein SUGI_0401350 [Cryptomeria japonica]
MSSCKALMINGQATSPKFVFGLMSSRGLSIKTSFRSTRTRACKSDASADSGLSQKNKKREERETGSMLRLPINLWRQTVEPLSNFGFGKKSIVEAGVGLFMMAGAVLLAFTVVWLKGFQLRSRSKKYQAVVEFSQACGITVGTPVRIRGFTVGSVVRVKPSLEKIDATIQVVDDRIVIPRNSFVEVNQSGLLMETLIDITPRPPIPNATAGPLDPDCSKEGLIVCDRQRIKGEQGVSLDELVGIFTRLGRQMDDISITKTYDLAERVGSVIEEAKPLLAKIEEMAGDIQPLLKDIREGGLLKEVERLTQSLADTSEDLRKLNSSILTPENTEMLRHLVSTLLTTLKNIESISGDISGLTGDAATRYNLKQLIDSLSKLIID